MGDAGAIDEIAAIALCATMLDPPVSGWADVIETWQISLPELEPLTIMLPFREHCETLTTGTVRATADILYFLEAVMKRVKPDRNRVRA